jgi:hypothetical protein
MRKLKIKTPSGITLRFSSDEPLTSKQILADIRLAMALDDELGDAVIHPDELARRIAAKGYDPQTGKPIH